MADPAATAQAIAQWDKGGADSWCAQNMLPLVQELIVKYGVLRNASLSVAVAHLSAYPEPAALDALTELLQSIVLSLISSTSPTLTIDAVVKFFVSLLSALPSSSAQDPRNTLNGILVDVIWILDVGLDDSLPPTGSGADISVEVRARVDANRRVLASLVRELVAQHVIPIDFCRQNLETLLLGLAGLLPDYVAFNKRSVRVRTAVHYKQTSYNLLREETEGFSKLVTEVVASVGPPHDPSTGYPVESSQTLRLRAAKAWENIIGLIGSFDLNANRVLDVIIDIFAGHALNNYAFFVELFRLTPWALVTKEPQYDRRIRGVLPRPPKGYYENMKFDDVIRAAELGPYAEEELHATRSCVLGQILGFKFAQFQLQDPEEKTSPRKLYFATALLIREGLLSPSDEDMEKGRAKYEANMSERLARAGQSSLGPSLGDAAPLRDGGPSRPIAKARPTDTKPTPTSAAPREPIPQKLNILRTLIGMGALRPAFLIVSKFPWVADAYPEVADQFLAMLNASTAQLGAPPTVDRGLILEKNQPLLDRIIVEAGKSPSTMPKKRSLVASCPVPRGNNYTEFIYFYPAWLDTVPICTTSREIFSVVEPFLRFTGVQGYRDLHLMTRLCRVGKDELSQISLDSEMHSALKDQWRNMLRRYLLPALSLTRSNAAFNGEVWSLLQFFDVTERWGIYGEWLSEAYVKYLELKVRHKEVTREVRGILRRVTSTGSTRLAVPLAKLAHSNPCIVFTECVKQAMAYDNLIEAIAEAGQCLTPMGYDVLVWCILTAFSNSSKPRMKEDGTSISLWLQSLSTYTATIYKKFGSRIDPAPILQWLAHRLKTFRSIDLIVLRELIAKTTSIQPQANLTDDQVVCMGGGPTLRVESIAPETRGSGSHAIVAANDLGTRQLLDALNKADLLVPLLVLIAQQREFCIERVDRSEEHLKHVSNLYDECQAVLFQYAEFLTVALGGKYGSILPPLDELCDKMALKPDIAFHLYRPALRDAVVDEVVRQSDEKERAQREEKEKALKQKLAAKRAAAVGEGNGTPSTTAVSPTADDTAAPMVVDPPTSTPSPLRSEAIPTVENKAQPWLPQLLPIIESARKILPVKASRVMSPGFYATFWQMSMYDLSPPEVGRIYEREIPRIRTLAYSVPKGKPKVERHLLTTYKLFMEEQKRVSRIHKATMERLENERAHWFPKNAATHPVVQQLALTCFYPRSLLSPTDAEFSARFMKVLHNIGTPGYSTLAAYSNLFGAHLGEMIFALSEHQAHNLGRFYRIALEDLDHFASDETSFKGGKPDDTPALPGFQRRFAVKDNVTYENLITVMNFRVVCGNWHQNLADALTQLLESDTYIGVRNAIIFLSKIASKFPKRASQGDRIIQILEKLSANEKRPDLQVLLKSYTATIKGRSSVWEQESSKAAVQKAAASSTQTPSNSGAPTAESNVPQSTAPAASAGNNLQVGQSDVSALDSVEKPAVIKRINREKSGSNSPRPHTPDIPTTSTTSTIPSIAGLPPRPQTSAIPISPRRMENSHGNTSSPRPHDNGYPPQKRGNPNMPPPSAPSSTPVANDLRRDGPSQQQNHTQSSGQQESAESARPPAHTPTEPGRNNRGKPRDKSPAAESNHSGSRSRPPSPARSSDGHGGRRRSDRARDDDERQRSSRITIAGAADRRERESQGPSSQPQSRSAGKEASRDSIHDRGGDRDRSGASGSGDRRSGARDRHANESDRERDRDRNRSGRDKDRDGDRDRGDRRDTDRGRRESYDGRRGSEKDNSRSRGGGGQRSMEDASRSTDDNSHKRRRDDEDGDPSKRRRGNEGSSYVPNSGDKDRDRDSHRDRNDTRDGGNSGRQHERGARRERGTQEAGSNGSGGGRDDKRRDKRDRNDERGSNGGGASSGRQDDAPSGRAPPTGPRSDRQPEPNGGSGGGGNTLVDRLGPPSPTHDRQSGGGGRGRDATPPRDNLANDGSANDSRGGGDSGSESNRKRPADTNRLLDQAVGNATGTSKRVKLDRTRRTKGKDS
ncbi:hypothetical protein DL93DRAFT_2098082 [Clavulina sp. PMI_390]|nr:hypothetical protein DL93DRAFT_2098082 [Clavulina sp. PMI_390]